MLSTGMIIFFVCLIALMLAAILLMVVLLVRQSAMAQNLDVDIDQDIDEIAESVARLGGQLDADRRHNAEFNASLRDSLENNLRSGMRSQFSALEEMSDKQMKKLQEMNYSQESAMRILISENAQQRESLLKENAKQKDEIIGVLKSSLGEIMDSNEKRLSEIQGVVGENLDKIQGVVGEKLDKTLNERLDSNFKQVGEQLANLYKSLGELRDLSSGVQDLNRTLTNVKTRGTFGEVQLGRILEQTMTPKQYETNVATKKNSSDRVEYAIKLPGLDESEIVYLPIDAKFPSDIYNAIVEASTSSDAEGLAKATAELKRRILDEARTIRDKYIDPPRTTNYAIMFLPTEGLYAEVLRIDGLTEECQRKNVIVTGPTTITAVLNSLQAGFRNLQLSKKSVEVMKLLEAIKTQFSKMDEDVQKTQKKLAEAVSANEKLQHRTGIIRSRMKKIGELEMDEAERILGIEEGESAYGEDTAGV